MGTTNNVEATGNGSKVAGETKVQSDVIEKVVVQERDYFLTFVLVMSFVVWSYFLYLLPSPDQLWRKRK